MHSLGDFYTEVVQQELNEIKKPEEINYIELHSETMREASSFKLQKFLSGNCNQNVKELTTDRKKRILLQIKKD